MEIILGLIAAIVVIFIMSRLFSPVPHRMATKTSKGTHYQGKR